MLGNTAILSDQIYSGRTFKAVEEIPPVVISSYLSFTCLMKEIQQLSVFYIQFIDSQVSYLN